jgi:peptide/nickel transport system permease protein
MTGLLLRRLAASLLLAYLVLTATFFLVHLAPGDPARLYDDPRAPRAQRQRLLHLYGLDRPLPEQYGRWLSAVAVGEWGDSFVYGRPVVDVLAEALPRTAALGLAALAVEYVAALGLGIAAARRAGRPLDHLIRIGSLALYALPIFWLGLMAILLFAYVWPVLPAGGTSSVGAEALPPAVRLADFLRHLLLPALVMGLGAAGGTARYLRNSLLGVLSQDYIRAARARGLSERRVLWVHGVRNALVPLTQVFAISLPALLNGSLVTEVVFSWPGLGRLAWGAILARDYPVVIASTALTGVLVVAGNLLGDLLLGLADPQVRDA